MILDHIEGSFIVFQDLDHIEGASKLIKA